MLLETFFPLITLNVLLGVTIQTTAGLDYLKRAI